MNPNPQSFADVADFCERHIESTRGQEVGLTFGAAIQALGRIATYEGDKDDLEWQRLNARVDRFLLEFSKRLIDSHGWISRDPYQPVNAMSMRTNMTYDTGGSIE